MAGPTIHERLTGIEAALGRIEARQKEAYAKNEGWQKQIDPAQINASMQDVIQVLNLVGQMREVHTNQRDQMSVLVGLAATLLIEARNAHTVSSDEREQISDLLVQLRELGRKHVTGLTDLERRIERR